MRITTALASLLLTLMVTACSDIEVRPAPTDNFAAAGYQYYKWRSGPPARRNQLK